MHSDHLSSLKAYICLMFFDFCLWQRFTTPRLISSNSLFPYPASLLVFGSIFLFSSPRFWSCLCVAVAFFVSAENKGTAISKKGFPGGTVGKESASQCGRCKRHEFDPWVEKIPWRREWQPTPVFLPGRPHGQRSLVGSSPWGHKESDTSEATKAFSFLFLGPKWAILWGETVSRGGKRRDDYLLGLFLPEAFDRTTNRKVSS